MRGNFARVTFEPLKHFTQVLQNQGRVHLEADWNEQGAIVLHLLRSVVSDIGGRAWRAETGFTLSWTEPTPHLAGAVVEATAARGRHLIARKAAKKR